MNDKILERLIFFNKKGIQLLFQMLKKPLPADVLLQLQKSSSNIISEDKPKKKPK